MRPYQNSDGQLLSHNHGILYLESMLGPTEIFLIALGIILLFGAKRIPGLIKGVIKGVHNFKEEISRDDESGDEKKDDKTE